MLELDKKLSSSSTVNQTAKDQTGKCARVVKNLNEFLNFTSLNKSRIMPSEDTEHLNKVSGAENSTIPIHDDCNSPDDLTDFFPMTTSMTRELRLEVESLDRQVNKKFSS